jgi:hypothetical protein
VFATHGAQHAPGTQHAPQPTREGAPAHTPQPQAYASAQPGPRGPAFEHDSRAESARPVTQYSGHPTAQNQRPEPRPEPQHQPRSEPQYQPRPEPQYQHRPEAQPQYQARPAPRSQPVPAPQSAGQAGHEGQRPEHHGEHNDHG